MSADLAMLNALQELAPILAKYGEVSPEFIKIKIEKYKEGTIIKLASDKLEVQDALSDTLKLCVKMADGGSTKIDVEEKDFR